MNPVSIDVQIQGLGSVLSAVSSLETMPKGRTVRRGVAQVTNLIAQEGRATLKARTKGKGTGNLRRSITAKLKRGKPEGLAGFRKGSGGGNHAHLVDQGTRERRTRRGEKRGWMPASYFWHLAKLKGLQAGGAIIRTSLEDAVQGIR